MTLAWGLEATAIFVMALAIGERSFRLSGVGLLLVCALKIVGYDVWHFSDTISRIVTLTAVGAILLGVSFLYGRYRDRIRELL
jgi:uncharacterized membrane protein